MAKDVNPIPEGCHTVTPYLVVKDAEKAIAFYKRAFGAEEKLRMPGPEGKGVMHAELTIGDSVIFLSDEFPGADCRSPQSVGGTTVNLHLYVRDVDASFKRALDAGAHVRMPVSDMFWGDRYGKIVDPFGHSWGIATLKEKLTPDEIGRRARAWFAEMGKQQQ